MKYYLGIDIGTFESKGVLSDPKGNIVARAAKPHKMLVPQAGWAEHRPIEDWWDDVTFICQKTSRRQQNQSCRYQGHRHQCHWPLHAAGE